MNQRFELTRYVLKEAGKPHDDVHVKKMLSAFWMNPRNKEKGGMRLTDSGWTWLNNAGIKYYQIDLPKEIEWANDNEKVFVLAAERRARREREGDI